MILPLVGAMMSRDEFVQAYAARSNVTVEYVLTHMNAYSCLCRDAKCNGWQMLTNKGAEFARTLALIGDTDEGS